MGSYFAGALFLVVGYSCDRPLYGASGASAVLPQYVNVMVTAWTPSEMKLGLQPYPRDDANRSGAYLLDEQYPGPAWVVFVAMVVLFLYVAMLKSPVSTMRSCLPPW